MTDNPLADHLLHLEQRLHQQSVRADAAELGHLLADDYFEHGINGTLWHKSAVIEALANEQFSERRISRFVLTRLAPDTALVTYRVERLAATHRKGASSLRSSIWQYRNTHWQMVFHQGTPLSSSCPQQ
ncbi:nuclear transport factor 2 family protein [Silvimonas amylolytica]|nr:nuclear transport factor 2 family protein [Silvimonas amylolytica]